MLLRIKGKGIDPDAARAVLWEIDQEVSPEKPPSVNVGARNQIELNIVVGPKSMTAQARHDAEIRSIQEPFGTGLSRVKDGDYAGALEVLEPRFLPGFEEALRSPSNLADC